MEGADDSGLECVGGTERPMKVSVRNDETGQIQTAVRCWDTLPGNMCANFNLLRAGGYAPGDWDEECPGE